MVEKQTALPIFVFQRKTVHHAAGSHGPRLYVTVRHNIPSSRADFHSRARASGAKHLAPPRAEQQVSALLRERFSIHGIFYRSGRTIFSILLCPLTFGVYSIHHIILHHTAFYKLVLNFLLQT